MPPLTIDGLAHPTVTRQIRELVSGHERILTRLRQLSDQLDAQHPLTLAEISAALSGEGSNPVTIIGTPGSIRPATVVDLTNLLAAAKAAYFKQLGGSRTVSSPLSASVQNCTDWRDVAIDWGSVAAMGWFLRAKVDVRANGTTTVQPQIFNVTDSTVDNGAVCSATNTDYSGSNQKQTITIAKPASLGVKVYRLRTIASDAVKGVFAINDYVEAF